jgi:hypothetical protein
VLRVRQPQAYGPDLVELAADVTAAAFGDPPPAAPVPSPRRPWRLPVGRRRD